MKKTNHIISGQIGPECMDSQHLVSELKIPVKFHDQLRSGLISFSLNIYLFDKTLQYNTIQYNTIPEDQWSCKRSPDYFPGINTTVKQEKILMSIKGCYSVANLQKMMLYNPNLDLVNDNVYTKFGHILSIRSQDIEKKPISYINQGP